MRSRHIILTSALFTFICVNTFAQELIWKAGIHTFFDNREYFNNYIEPQSMLGARTFAQGGFNIDETNRFYAGGNVLYEFGSRNENMKLSPILYFEHIGKEAQLNMGAFPRVDLFELPAVLQHDTFQYYRPNVEGIFIKFSKPWGSQTAWLDWTSRQTNVDRETFIIGGTGILNSPLLFFRYDFIIFHYAGAAISDTNDHIRDNGGLASFVGINLSEHSILDTLTLSLGGTMSYDRLRHIYETDYRTGSLINIYAGYKMFALRSTTYFGEGQTQMLGDGLYSAKFYSRLDLILNLFQKSKIKSQVEFSLHFLPEVVDVSQKLSVYLTLGGKSQKLKNTF